jgi:phosphate uptake regulator
LIGLQPGSLVSLSYQDEGTLLLTPSTTKTVTSHKTLKLDGEKNGLRRDIIGAYVMGHQFIELNARTIPQEIRKEIQGICKGLIGSEIVEETKEKIVIYDILDPGEFTIDKGLKRMYALVLKAGCVSKEDQLNLVEAFHYRLAADNLERIGDHTVKIANTFASIDSDDLLPRDITDKIAGVGRNSLDSVEKSIISLRRADVALAGSVLRENAKIRKSISVINQLKTDTSNALPITRYR